MQVEVSLLKDIQLLDHHFLMDLIIHIGKIECRSFLGLKITSSGGLLRKGRLNYMKTPEHENMLVRQEASLPRGGE